MTQGAGNKIAIDITAVKKMLKDHRDLEDVVSAIRRYEASRSVLFDLEEAKLAVTEIANIELVPALRQRFGAALMTHAIISYCRATHSKADARWNVGVTKKYTADQMTKHRQIGDLRDKVIAHFGFPAEAHGVGWLEERAVIRSVDGVEVNSFAWRRANYLGAAVADINELLTVAIETGEQIAQEKSDAMTDAIFNKVDDQRVRFAIDSSPFDPLEFWGRGETAEKFWESSRGEKTEIFALRFQTAGQSTSSG